MTTPHDAEGIVKPCPWCGSTMPPSQRETDGSKWGALSCSECSATAPEVRTGYGPFPTWYDDALKAWNDRPAEATRLVALSAPPRAVGPLETLQKVRHD